MNFRHYLLIFGSGTIIAWTAWVVVLFNINPMATSAGMLFVFYFTLFVGLLGLIATIATSFRMIRGNDDEIEDIVARSLRQAFFITVIVILALLLASREWLNWISVIGLVGIFSALEYFWLTRNGEK